MLTRRQFCGVLGGTVIGGTVFAGSKSMAEEKKASFRDGHFSASKIHWEQWFTELRHQPIHSRLDELRKRFAEIRTHSEAVLFAPGEGVTNAFQKELTHEAKEAGLRILAPAEGPETAWAVLEEIQTGANDFTTLVFPLTQTGNRIPIAKPFPSQTVCGYLYARFLGKSVPSVPLAVILFEPSRCLWETYVFGPVSGNALPGVSQACVDRGYARLIDRTRERFS